MRSAISNTTLVVSASRGAWPTLGMGKLVPGEPCALLRHSSPALPCWEGVRCAQEENQGLNHILCCIMFSAGLIFPVKQCHHTEVWQLHLTKQCVTGQFVCFGDAWGWIRKEEAKEKQFSHRCLCTFVQRSLRVKTSWIGRGIHGRVGIDGGVDVPLYWLSPVHQERYQDPSLKTTGSTMFSCQEGLWWVPEFQKRLGRKAKDSCMAGQHSIMKPWHGVLQLCLGSRPVWQIPFCHPFSWMAALWFSERIFNQELNT